MISVAAVALALAFWAPYNGGQPICPDGVSITTYAPGQGPEANPYANGWAIRGNGCAINVSTEVPRHGDAVTCAIIAHELGHARMGLPDSLDPRNVMADIPGAYITIPAACSPPVVSRGRQTRSRPSRPRACGSSRSRCPTRT